MTQTIKERLKLLKKRNPELNEYADSYAQHIYVRNKGFNEGVDACLPLLEEVDTRLHAYMDFVDDMATGHIFSTAFENLEKALTPPTK